MWGRSRFLPSSWHIIAIPTCCYVWGPSGGKMLQSVRRKESDSLLTVHPLKLRAAPSQVVIRPFHLGWQSTNASNSRANRLIADVLSLDDEQVEEEYRAILSDFSERHWQTEGVFDHRFTEVAQSVKLPRI